VSLLQEHGHLMTAIRLLIVIGQERQPQKEFPNVQRTGARNNTRPGHKSINQAINQPINQPIIQPINTINQFYPNASMLCSNLYW